MNKSLSLILCSRNRARILQKSLFLLPVDEVAKHKGEIICVNSASSDQTLEIFHAFKKNACVSVTVVDVDRSGLGLARNKGIEASNGESLIFWDDDVYFDSDYFAIASKLFQNTDVDYCGGLILPYDTRNSFYGCYFKDEFEIVPPYSLIHAGQFQGTNLIIHRDVFNKIGLFDPALGAGTKFRFEDLDFIARASMSGFSGAHIPGLIVCHDHHRKEGPEIEDLKTANHLARGAFFTKMFLLGYFGYLTLWIKLTVFNPWMTRKEKYHVFKNEMKGAISYLYFRSVRGIFG